MKKCVEIREMLFKNGRLLFENTHQTPPKILKNASKRKIKDKVLL